MEYVTGARELFNLKADPQETRNVISKVSRETVTGLSNRLSALSACSGPSCRVADTWQE